MALVMGCLLGTPLAVTWALRRPLRLMPEAIVQLMRAAPTFVVMFFLLNVLPRSVSVLGFEFLVTRSFTVALSLVPYSASVVAESGAEALRQWRQGSVLAALLLLPNLARIYFVLVMASGSAAAIGVSEGIAVILREAGNFTSIADRLWVFAIGVVAYGLILQSGFLTVMAVKSYLAGRAMARQVVAWSSGGDRG